MESARREERASVNDWIMLTAMLALLSPFLVAFSALLLLTLVLASPLFLLATGMAESEPHQLVPAR